MNESNSTEWLVQPKRVCQTWFLLLSYLSYKWSRGEETGLISDKTSNPWAPYVEKSIADFERGLTQHAADLPKQKSRKNGKWKVKYVTYKSPLYESASR